MLGAEAGSGLGLCLRLRLGLRLLLALTIALVLESGFRLQSRGCRTPMRMYAYAYECSSHATPPSTSKVQRRQGSVVLQTLRQLIGSVIADVVACKPHARARSCVGELIF